MNFIQWYAPTNDSNEDDNDQFYERLKSIVEKWPGKDLTNPMEDLNAMVEMDDTEYKDIIRWRGLGEKKGNYEKFANLRAFNKSDYRWHHLLPP